MEHFDKYELLRQMHQYIKDNAKKVKNLLLPSATTFSLRNNKQDESVDDILFEERIAELKRLNND